jgi:RNA polymerase sigma-70 factor (ECF subfamily)
MSLLGSVEATQAPAARGDAGSFELELRPLLGDALRLATGMLLNGQDAEDAVQEACLRAWHRRGNRRPGTELRPWFLAIVANQCRETRRGSWWRVLRVAQLPERSTRSGIDREDSIDLRRALEGVEGRRRTALTLRYYLDLPYETVAATMGCSIDAAKALVRRGTADLTRALGGVEAWS